MRHFSANPKLHIAFLVCCVYHCSYLQQTQLKVKKKPVANIKPRHAGGASDIAASRQSKEDTCESVKDPFRLEVKVLNCPSPSCIYVALLVQKEQIRT